MTLSSFRVSALAAHAASGFGRQPLSHASAQFGAAAAQHASSFDRPPSHHDSAQWVSAIAQQYQAALARGPRLLSAADLANFNATLARATDSEKLLQLATCLPESVQHALFVNVFPKTTHSWILGFLMAWSRAWSRMPWYLRQMPPPREPPSPLLSWTCVSDVSVISETPRPSARNWRLWASPVSGPSCASLRRPPASTLWPTLRTALPWRQRVCMRLLCIRLRPRALPPPPDTEAPVCMYCMYMDGVMLCVCLA